MSLKHFSLSFLIPIIPICFAWDGAVSNARTYTPANLDELLAGVSREGYQWSKGVRAAGLMQQLYLIGTPTNAIRAERQLIEPAIFCQKASESP